MCFQLAAYLALCHSSDELEIWNDPLQTRNLLLKLDPKWTMREHPGMFVFRAGDKTVCLAGDGRVLDRAGDNVWERHMAGDSVSVLAERIAAQLDF